MKAVFFFHQNLGYAPVKKYLAQYQNQTKKLADFHAKIQYLASIDGRPEPPIFKSLRGYGVCEIRIRKTAKVLVRILYFRYRDMLVLVHAFEKPDYYNSAKIDKEIEGENRIADSYRLIFESNPKLYESYP